MRTIQLNILLMLLVIPMLLVASHHGKGGEIPYLLTGIGISSLSVVIAIASVVKARFEKKPILDSTILFMVATIWLFNTWSWSKYIAKQGVNRLPCPSNLKQLGGALLLYSLDHDGRYPGRLEDLVATEDLSTEILICPNDKKIRAKNASELEGTGHAHCSYIFLANGWLEKEFPPDALMAYEPSANHGEGSNVLMGDGSVRFVYSNELEQLLHKPTTRRIASTKATTTNLNYFNSTVQ